MKQRLISRVEFSLLANVSQAAVTRACLAALAPACVGRRVDASHKSAVEYVARRRIVDGDAPDPLYDPALEFCISEGRFTQTAILRRFNIGVGRAKRILDAMRAAGVVPGAGAPVPKPSKPAPKKNYVRGKAARKAKQKAEMDEGVYEIPENIREFENMTVREVVDKFGTDERFYDFLTAVQKIEMINEKRLKTAKEEGTLVSRDLVQRVIDIFNAAHLRLMKDGAKSISAGVVSKHSSGAGTFEIEEYVSEILGSFIKPVKNKAVRSLNGA